MIKPGEYFITGNEACAYGAILANCRFFGGYPITPSTEIAETMAILLPKVGGMFIQMEDELASITTVLGASCAGKKAMTATSGPGFSLMQETIGLAAMCEIPCVIVDVQRAGPSTGLPTLPAQADMFQAKFGSHGDYEIIALCPKSPQELFEHTIKAFNYSEMYRVPTIILTDECVGHMSEKVTIQEEIEVYERTTPTMPFSEYIPFGSKPGSITAMAIAGQGYNVHFTGLTHNEYGYPVMDNITQEKCILRITEKIRKNAEKIVMYEHKYLDDAEIVVVSYGISARVAEYAVKLTRNKNLKIGFIRLITPWPFPEKFIAQVAKKIKMFIVVEMNMGQMIREVERCGKINTVIIPNPGGKPHTHEEISKIITKYATS